MGLLAWLATTVSLPGLASGCFYKRGTNGVCITKSLPARFVGWWLALAALMLTIQALLTFAGNFAIAPLSGLTMPMVSYGSATMLFCTLVMSLSYAKENMS